MVEAGPVRRAWGAPLWAHAAVLAVVVLAVFPLMRPTSAFTSDEGAYALQVAALDNGSWEFDYRAAPLDPEGRAFPVVLSDSGPDGYYTYVKHPAYPVLLQAGSRLVGRTLGLHLFSLMGMVGAAVAAWLLAGELDARLRRPAFWLAAGGPVLVNGFLIWAHAPSAALAGLALAAAARIARRGVTPWAAVAMSAALAGGVLLRSEGLLLAGALAVSLAAVRFAHRRPIAALAVVALAAGPALLVAVVERWWISSIVGGTYGNVAGQGSTSSSFVDDRLTGAWHVLFKGWFIDAGAGVPVLAALAVVAGGGFLALRRPGRGLTVVVVVAVALLAVRFAAHPHDPVTGLLSAWPLAVLGLLMFRWRDAGPVAWLLGGTIAMFTLATLATQYPEGGGLEWGGRYLSPALVPLAVLATAGLARAVAGVAGEPGRRRAVALLAALGVTTAVFSVATVGALRAREDRIVAAVERHPSPVMVTTRPALPRLAWRAGDRLNWMLTSEASLPDLLASLRGQGVAEVGVVAGVNVPAFALSAYPTSEERPEPALADDGLRLTVLRGR